jgi:hypothetical protein
LKFFARLYYDGDDLKSRGGGMVVRRILFLIVILCINSQGFGHFYYMSIVKHYTHNGCQHIVLLADYHDKKHPANTIQRSYLEYLLQRCCKQKIKLIVEDLSSSNNDGRMMCANYGINCATGMLGHLAYRARSWGIDVDNIEYRYCRVASIGPLLSNITADPHTFKSSTTITLISLYKEIMNEVEKIKQYDDGKKINTFYQRILEQVHTRLSHLKLGHSDETLARYVQAFQKSEYQHKLEELCIFDSGLIDSNILHSIMQSDAAFIFVVAGGSHIEQVNRVLKMIGYKEICASRNSNFEPIDVTVLEKFLK